MRLKFETTEVFYQMTKNQKEFYRLTRGMSNWQRTQWNRWQFAQRKEGKQTDTLESARRFTNLKRKLS